MAGEKINVLSLFCGAVGGWDAGLARTGFYRTVAACEIDPWRRSVFLAQHPGCRMYDDVRSLTAERIGNDLGYLPDVVVGSPPCQEISAANSQGEGITDDHLFWDAVRLVFEIRPVWCAAENSPRARTSGIDGVLDALAQAGYAAWPLVVGADNAGANHRRKRMWLVAADAERLQLREQPGRRGGTDGRGAAVAGEHDPNACLAEPTGRHSNGRRLESAQEDARTRLDAIATAADAGCLGSGSRVDPAGRQSRTALGGDPHPDSQGRSDGDGDAPHADCVCDGRGAPGQKPPTGEFHDYGCIAQDARDHDRPRHPLRPRLGSDDTAELPSALRAIGLAWPHWNGGIAGLSAACAAAGACELDDGSAVVLPAGVRNRAIAALGDAVVSAIPEAIGRAMRMCKKKGPPAETGGPIHDLKVG